MTDVDAIKTLWATAECARSWEPDARLLGNVRAEDMHDACIVGVRAIELLAKARAELAALRSAVRAASEVIAP